MRYLGLVAVASALFAVMVFRPEVTNARLEDPICQIVVSDNGFNPSTVHVPPGTFVLWLNMSSTDQTVVSVNQSQFPWLLGPFPPNTSVQLIASDLGTFEYTSELRPGQKASVVVEEGPLDCRRPTLPAPRPCPSTPGAVVKRIAVILFNFEDDTSEPWTVDDLRQVLFTDPEYATSSWYCEVSLGKIVLQGKVHVDGDYFGWYTIPYSFTSCPMDLTDAIDSIVASQGVDLSGYNHIMYVSNASGCPRDAGQLGVDPGRTWNRFAAGELPQIIIHELGHNYGLAHANSYVCTEGGEPVPVSDTCESIEYGDPFDAMGTGGMGHFNAYNKARLGYLDAHNIVTVTRGGTYSINPIEAPSDGIQLLRVPTTDGRFFNFEYRQNIGFDNAENVPGVYARFSPDLDPISPAIWDPTELIDLTPEDGDFHHAAMPHGFVFVDPFTGNRVELKSESPEGAVLAVELSSPGAQLTQGDVDCKDGVSALDALSELRVTAQLAQLPQQEPCPDIGEEVESSWGDVNCDGSVGALDALAILRFVAALPPLAQQEPCVDVGAEVFLD